MPVPAVWPVAANSRDSIIEEYGYQTQIMRALSGMEQRVKMRRHPIGGLTASYFCDDTVDAQHALAVLYANLTKPMIIPLWQYARLITVDAGIGTTVLTVDTSDVPFRDPLGFNQYAIIWNGVRSYEAVKVAGISPSSVTIEDGTVKAWTAGKARLVTARIGRLLNGAPTTWLTNEVVDGSLQFTFEPGRKPVVDLGITTEEFIQEEGQVLPIEG